MTWREVLALHAHLDRDGPDSPTRVRIGGHAPIPLPGFDDPGREAAVERMAAILEQTWRTAGAGLDVDAGIRMNGRSVAVVPHGDVVAVLDAFWRAGLERIEYQGSYLPRPRPPFR